MMSMFIEGLTLFCYKDLKREFRMLIKNTIFLNFKLRLQLLG